jgi:hypothetical protein
VTFLTLHSIDPLELVLQQLKHVCDWSTILFKLVKIKLSLQRNVEAYRVARRRGSHIFYTIATQMAVMLSALCGDQA